MSAAALHGANFGALAWTLLCLLAAVGSACLIVGLTIAAFCIVSGNRDRRAKRKRHGGTLPRATFENFREPFDRERLPDSGLTTEQLDDWPVLDREPRP